MNEIVSISPAPWEFERHRRGVIRWHGASEINGAWGNFATAGGVATLADPWIHLRTAAGGLPAGASANYRKTERQLAAGGTILWGGYDGKRYLGRDTRLTIFMQPDTSPVASGNCAIGIFLMDPSNLYAGGVRLWDTAAYTTPRNAFVWEKYADGSRAWALYSCPGTPNGPMTRVALTGVTPPSPDPGAGNPYMCRMELVYSPDSYLAALVDGVEGARITGAALPLSTFAGLGTTQMSGFGCWSGFDGGSQCLAHFGGLMFETSFA